MAVLGTNILRDAWQRAGFRSHVRSSNRLRRAGQRRLDPIPARCGDGAGHARRAAKEGADGSHGHSGLAHSDLHLGRAVPGPLQTDGRRKHRRTRGRLATAAAGCLCAGVQQFPGPDGTRRAFGLSADHRRSAAGPCTDGGHGTSGGTRAGDEPDRSAQRQAGSFQLREEGGRCRRLVVARTPGFLLPGSAAGFRAGAGDVCPCRGSRAGADGRANRIHSDGPRCGSSGHGRLGS